MSRVELASVGLGAYQVERTIVEGNFQSTSEVSVAGTGLRLDGVRFVDPQHLVIQVSAPTVATLGDNDVT